MYTRKPVTKLLGTECFKNYNSTSTILDFWRYGFSNLNSNILRGVLAEFIVENALKALSDITMRNPWGDCDVIYHNTKIEVKCCSYLQDWDQKSLSTIKWSGLKATELYYSDAVKKRSEVSKIPEYKSDIYILCLLHHQETDTLDILDMNQWSFYVLSQDMMRDLSRDRSSISLKRLEKHNIQPVTFDQIKNSVEALVYA